MTTLDRFEPLINSLLDSARYIIGFETDWDEEGSDPFDPAIVYKACWAAKMICLRLWKDGYGWFERLSVLPCPGGSIDLEWYGPDGFGALMNVPHNYDVDAGAYIFRDSVPKVGKSWEHEAQVELSGNIETVVDLFISFVETEFEKEPEPL